MIRGNLHTRYLQATDLLVLSEAGYRMTAKASKRTAMQLTW